ncbi:MAG: glycosyltransferase family 39 protein [bacterium]|nr:glycosyltransferase family 39 protein [bacterium]
MRRSALSLLAVAAPLVVAAALRGWGLAHGELVWHPDEIFMVVIPLGFFGGDLNPHQFHYPSAHFYLLGAAYGLLYLTDLARGLTGGLYEWVALHGLFEMERLRDLARWVSFAFSVGTVGLTGMVADRIAGRSAGVVAASALAVSVLHVRQAQIAGVDSAMAFWFVAALWAALRLTGDRRLRAYLLCGLFIGLCAATKYPGVAAAGGVMGAHLLAGRSLLDWRLWAAGLASVVTFSLLSPYVWLDADTFLRHFRFQLDHVQTGNSPVFLPVLYHLWFSLRYSLGEPGWLIMLGIICWALLRRVRQLDVILCAFAFAYALVSWGELVFVRYAMPLFALQAILLGAAIPMVASKLSQYRGRRLFWLGILAAVTLALPTARAFRVATISAAVDTRTQAAQWMAQNVPSGSRCCNFGGWGGDVQVRTFEHLWWLLVRHEEAYGLTGLEEIAPRLQPATVGRPYYSFTAGGDRTASAAGSWDLVDDVQCAYVLIHDHPLPSSHLDSSFVAQLEARGQRLASFQPGSGVNRAEFDPMDAYYIPFAHMDGIQRPGPAIEIWRIDGQPQSRRPIPSVNERLAKAHALLSMSATRDKDWPLALQALQLASRYMPTDPTAVKAWGRLSTELGRTQDAVDAFGELRHLEPGYADGLEGLSTLWAQEGNWPAAVATREAAAALQPHSAGARRQWAYALAQAGQNDAALHEFREALRLAPQSATTRHAIGTLLFQSGETIEAAQHLDLAVLLAPENADYHLDAGVAHERLGHADAALRLWQRAAELSPGLVNAHRYIAHAARDLGDTTLALAHWRALRRLDINDAVVLEGARALLDLNRAAEAAVWITDYLGTRTDTSSTELSNTLRATQGR